MTAFYGKQVGLLLYVTKVNYCLIRAYFAITMYMVYYHRLRGSASPVLKATHHSYGSPRLSEFFPPQQ